jgi:two-component system, chemotaxis family, protein-glutamate methylesterase/glutaminase
VSHAKLRVLVVDDSVVYRKIIRDILSEIPDVETVGVARDGVDALDKIEIHDPDLVTLDVEMPLLDGLAVLREMRRRGLRSKAIMVSATTEKGARATMEALAAGAFDFVVKPQAGATSSANAQDLKNELTHRVETFRAMNSLGRGIRIACHGQSTAQRTTLSSGDTAAQILNAIPNVGSVSGSRRTGCYAAVVIGVSTGGPDALRQFLPRVPGDFPLPILVVQHMPPVFTKSLADSLNAMCDLIVKEAADGDLVQRGQILIAPGGRQMKVVRSPQGARIKITDDPPMHNCRPAVDYLFKSAVDVFGWETLGLIMTGMGSDGTDGCRLIKHAGGSVIAQSPDSCVVYGMPRIPVEEGLADSVVPLANLAEELQAYTVQEVTV